MTIQQMPQEENLHDQVIVDLFFPLIFIFIFQINFSAVCKGSSFPFKEDVGRMCKICSFVRIQKRPETETMNQNFSTKIVKVNDFGISTNKEKLYNLYRKQNISISKFCGICIYLHG